VCALVLHLPTAASPQIIQATVVGGGEDRKLRGTEDEPQKNHKILNRACSAKVQLQTVEKETYLGSQGASQ